MSDKFSLNPSRALFYKFGYFTAIIASLAVAVDNIIQLGQQRFYFSTFCFFLMFFLGLFLSSKKTLSIFILLIALIPTLETQIKTYIGIAMSTQSMIGFDLVAGYFITVFVKNLLYGIMVPKFQLIKHLSVPWPVSLVLAMISLSATLAVLRNGWQSASYIDLEGIGFGFLLARNIGWLEDLRPINDWLAYGLSGAVIILTINALKASEERNSYVFQPIILGLFLSGILALIQSRSGLGVGYLIKDSLGYAAFGFQPDIHAFAGYTLMGALGLWGFLLACKNQVERAWVYIVIALSWVGLVLSLSRATQLIAIATLSMFALTYFGRVLSKKIFFKFVIRLLLLIGLTLVFIFIFRLELISLIPERNLDFLRSLSVTDWSSFAQVNTALSERPVLYLNALRMWFSFPVFGVGQGNFYHLLPIFNIEHIGNSLIINGENAHNYFLQTLAETGLAGLIAFAVAIAAPFFLVKNRSVLWPAAVALFSLFLGNIFAHSFLVRENLFLAAVFVGLMYSYVPTERLALSPLQLLKEWNPKLPWKAILPLSCIVIVGLGSREIYKSFYSFPFQYGTLCFVNKPLTPDGWSSGLYEIPLPAGSHGAELSIKIARPNLHESPLRANFEIIDSGNRVLASQAFEWRESGPQKLVISMPNGATIQDSGAKVALRLSSCYTPRNLGESIDGRRLGVIVDSSIIH